MLQYLVATKTSTWKKRLYFGLQSKKKPLRETHGLKNQFFFPVSKYYLKSVFSGKNKINTAARKIKVQTAGTHKPLIQAIPFRILRVSGNVHPLFEREDTRKRPLR